MTIPGEIPSTYQELLPLYQAVCFQLQTVSTQYEALETKVAYLTQELARLKKLISGAKSERFVPETNGAQSHLTFMTSEPPDAPEVQSEDITYTRKKAKVKFTPHGRNPLPEHLPRKERVIEPECDTSGMKRIGEEVTEELEYEPGKLYVNRYVRPKYAHAEGVLIAALPVRPIEKGIAGPGLLAHLAISKYVDHLPLYRQRKQFLRHDVKLPASTLGDWIRATCELLTPLDELQRSLIQKAAYLQVDETPIRVQACPERSRRDPQTRGKCHRGYLWAYYDPLTPAVLFDYRQSRKRDGPEEMLKDFSGYLQTDGYQGYDEIGARDAITHLGCFAHARRYFTDALANDAVRAEWMLLRLQKLYATERIAREQGHSHPQRFELRQSEALPVLAEMHAWLQQQREQVLPKSDIGKAIAYMLKYWARLTVYTTDGMLQIDNNPVENGIRPVALGRKNYLFAGSHDGARRAALIYSLVGTAQLHQLEPFAYLRDVIARISEHPHKQLSELLPQNWKRTVSTHTQS